MVHFLRTPNTQDPELTDIKCSRNYHYLLKKVNVEMLWNGLYLRLLSQIWSLPSPEGTQIQTNGLKQTSWAESFSFPPQFSYSHFILIILNGLILHKTTLLPAGFQKLSWEWKIKWHLQRGSCIIFWTVLIRVIRNVLIPNSRRKKRSCSKQQEAGN